MGRSLKLSAIAKIVPRGTGLNWVDVINPKTAVIAMTVPRGTIMDSCKNRIAAMHGKSQISPAG